MVTTKVEMPLHTLLVSGLITLLVESDPHNSIDLVGSTLSDPYLAYSAALFALAGPLHG